MGWNGVVTLAGTDLFANYAIGGKTLALKGVQLGSGIKTVSRDDKRDVTSLNTYVCDGIVGSQSAANGAIQYRIEVGPGDDDTTYDLHEIGLIVEATSSGTVEDVLVAYMWNTDGVTIPSHDSFPDFLYILTTTLANISAEVTFSIPSGAYVPYSAIFNGLGKSDAGYALDARQAGEILKDIAIFVDGDTAPQSIPSGKYIILNGHSTLDDGVYCSKGISSGSSITSSKVTAVTGGAVNGIVDSLVYKAEWLIFTGNNWSSAWEKLETLGNNRAYVFYANGNGTGILTNNVHNDIMYGIIAKVTSHMYGFVGALNNLNTMNLILGELKNANSTSAGTYTEFNIAENFSNYVSLSKVYNGLDKTDSGFVLDARQGKELDDKKADLSIIASEYDSSPSGQYAPGELRTHEKKLYERKIDSTGGGNWDPSEWREVEIEYLLWRFKNISGNIIIGSDNEIDIEFTGPFILQIYNRDSNVANDNGLYFGFANKTTSKSSIRAIAASSCISSLSISKKKITFNSTKDLEYTLLQIL